MSDFASYNPSCPNFGIGLNNNFHRTIINITSCRQCPHCKSWLYPEDQKRAEEEATGTRAIENGSAGEDGGGGRAAGGEEEVKSGVWTGLEHDESGSGSAAVLERRDAAVHVADVLPAATGDAEDGGAQGQPRDDADSVSHVSS